MAKILILGAIFFFNSHLLAKEVLLDRIVAAVDQKSFTQSEVRRWQQNLDLRHQVAPFIYLKTTYTDQDLLQIAIDTMVIRAALKENGQSVSDGQVEMQIKDTENRLHTNRTALKGFLRENQMSFDEYFELMRESLERSFFIHQIINPLVTITEQEVKNTFYKIHQQGNTKTFRYELVSFHIEQHKIDAAWQAKLPAELKKFQNSGILPDPIRDISVDQLGELEEDGLAKPIASVVAKTAVGEFSAPVIINDQVYVFFVKHKKEVETANYRASQEQIRQHLFEERALSVARIWLDRERTKHYIALR